MRELVGKDFEAAGVSCGDESKGGGIKGKVFLFQEVPRRNFEEGV